MAKEPADRPQPAVAILRQPDWHHEKLPWYEHELHWHCELFKMLFPHAHVHAHVPYSFKIIKGVGEVGSFVMTGAVNVVTLGCTFKCCDVSSQLIWS